MSLRITLLSLVMLMAFPGWALAFQGYTQTFRNGGTLAWGNGSIVVARPLAVPEGEESVISPLAVRKAATGARKQMLDIIKVTRIDSKRTVSAYLAQVPDLAARVRGMVQNSPMTRPSAYAEEAEVRVTEQFRGKLAELVLPTTIPFQSGIPPRLSASMEQTLDFNGSEPEVTGEDAVAYTGVIIDARGMKVTPCLTPNIYGQDGLGAYGAFLVSRANAVRKGVVAYANSVDPAALRSRVGSNPLIVKALNAYGSWRTDLIVSTPMANLVRATMKSPKAAANCRVVIVLGSR